jgi:TRAP-type C4-dicarboxylate transport system substrate-binding protein
MYPTRRTTLAAAVSVPLTTPLLARAAAGAEFTWRIGHTAPPDFPLHKRLVEAASLIAKRSEGRIAVQVYDSGILGSQVGLLAQLRNNTIACAPLTSQTLAADLTIAALPTVGFAFPDYPHVWAAMDGSVGTFLRERIQVQLGIEPMDRCWDFGFRQISTVTKTIQSPADLANLRIRTPPEADLIAFLRALKALPLAMPVSAMATAFRGGSLDGQDSVLGLIQAAELAPFLGKCALTNHVWDGQWLCVSAQAWTNLPAKLQDIVATALNDAGLKQRADTQAADEATRKSLEAQGLHFNAVDTATFREELRSAGYYAAWHARMGDAAWSTLQRQTGLNT